MTIRSRRQRTRRLGGPLAAALAALLPAGPAAQAEVDVDATPVERLDFPIAPGPFEPTWESIHANHPGEVPWFREAKLGVWIHWGPQAMGEAGDWYAKKMYLEDDPAAAKHRRRFGHPSEFGYKDVLNEWKAASFDADALVRQFHDAGFRYAIVMGVHHDNFDLWDSRHQPWNATNVGPRRNILKEWLDAAKRRGMRAGVSFHHEYTWWWWQPAFSADTKGKLAGVPYDGRLTAADGVGKWWEGLDPARLYGRPLEGYPEYEPVHLIAHGRQGVFHRHADYAREYATQWAARIQDVADRYDVDFIYTDGNSTQPFSGKRSGSGYKCDAGQRVVAHFLNRSLERRGKIDTFAVVKFSKPQNGLASTSESRTGKGIENRRMWMGERAVGSWFYAPGFQYDAGSAIRAMLEYVARDGNFALSVPITPDGSLTADAVAMLQELGDWTTANGQGIYGSRAWRVWGEGENRVPGGAIGPRTARRQFTTADLRFTQGADGALYAWCMTVPAAGESILVRSLAPGEGTPAPQSVELLGGVGQVAWSVGEEGLRVEFAEAPALKHAIGLRVTF